MSLLDFIDSQERIKELSHLIASLPIANYSLLRALTAHLILIVQNAGINKMTMRNVGIVFSPTLGIPAGVFSLMLGEFNRVFNVDAGGDDDNGEDDNSYAAEDPIRRNSRQYSDAAADQLLGLAGRSLTGLLLIYLYSCTKSTDSCHSSCRRRTLRRRQHVSRL
jgi:RalA-binding protein 1